MNIDKLSKSVMNYGIVPYLKSQNLLCLSRTCKNIYKLNIYNETDILRILHNINDIDGDVYYNAFHCIGEAADYGVLEVQYSSNFKTEEWYDNKEDEFIYNTWFNSFNCLCENSSIFIHDGNFNKNPTREWKGCGVYKYTKNSITNFALFTYSASYYITILGIQGRAVINFYSDLNTFANDILSMQYDSLIYTISDDKLLTYE